MCFANATSKKVGGLTSEGAANSVNSIEQNQHEHHTSPARSLPRQVYKEKKCVEGVPARSSTLDEVKVQIVNTCSSCQVQRGTFSNFWDRPQYSALVFHTLNIYSSISEKEFATVCFFFRCFIDQCREPKTTKAKTRSQVFTPPTFHRRRERSGGLGCQALGQLGRLLVLSMGSQLDTPRWLSIRKSKNNTEDIPAIQVKGYKLRVTFTVDNRTYNTGFMHGSSMKLIWNNM